MAFPVQLPNIVDGFVIRAVHLTDVYDVLGTNPGGSPGGTVTTRLQGHDAAFVGLSATYLRGINVSASPSGFVKVVYSGGNNSVLISANPQHNLLIGLSTGDDHPQYLNQARAASGFLQISNQLSELASNPSAARNSLGLGVAATANYGPGGVAQYNDSRIVNALQGTQNLADLPDKAAARGAGGLNLGTGAQGTLATTPTSAGINEIVLGADTRLTNARSPSAHNQGYQTISDWLPGLSASLAVSGGAVAVSGSQVVIIPAGAGSAGTIDHNALQNLTSGNPHPQYLYKTNLLNEISASPSAAVARGNLRLGTASVLPSATSPTLAATGEVVLGQDSRLGTAAGALSINNMLSEISAGPSATQARVNLGLRIGTDVAAFNDTRIVSGLESYNLLKEISAGPSASVARTSLGLSAGATAGFGTTPGTILDGAFSNNVYTVSGSLISLSSNFSNHLTAASAHLAGNIRIAPPITGLVANDVQAAATGIMGIVGTSAAGVVGSSSGAANTIQRRFELTTFPQKVTVTNTQQPPVSPVPGDFWIHPA